MIAEHEIEPVPGLPGNLPPGERILWQGSPDWKRLAYQAFHVRAFAVYFAGLAVWGLVQALRGTGTWLGAGITLGLGIAGIVVLLTLAWAMARSTIYTLTNRRIVMRIGVALPKCINLPLAALNGADLRCYPDQTGDIPLNVTGTQSVGWIALWPHVRPWAINTVQPMLRAVPDAERLAGLIARTTATACGTTPIASAPQLAVAA